MKVKKFSRRKFLPLLGGTALLPFLGFSQKNNPSKHNNLKTILRADGTSVQVDESILKEARIVKKNLSNRSLLGWLKPKSKN